MEHKDSNSNISNSNSSNSSNISNISNSNGSNINSNTTNLNSNISNGSNSNVNSNSNLNSNISNISNNFNINSNSNSNSNSNTNSYNTNNTYTNNNNNITIANNTNYIKEKELEDKINQISENLKNKTIKNKQKLLEKLKYYLSTLNIKTIKKLNTENKSENINTSNLKTKSKRAASANSDSNNIDLKKIHFTDGIKYGTDILIYFDSPDVVHSSFGLLIHHSDQKLLKDDVIAKQRLMSSVGKELIIAKVNDKYGVEDDRGVVFYRICRYH